MDKKVSILGFATSTYMRSYVDFIFKDLSFSALDMLLTAKSDGKSHLMKPLNNFLNGEVETDIFLFSGE